MSETRNRWLAAVVLAVVVLGSILASAPLAGSQPNERRNENRGNENRRGGNPCVPPDLQPGVRPGWGHGDPNHEHTGPPGLCRTTTPTTGPTTTTVPTTTTTTGPTTTTVPTTTTTMAPTTTTMAPTTTTVPTTTTTTQGGGGQTAALRVTVAPTCVTPGGGVDVLVQAIDSAGNVVTTETRVVEGTVNGQANLAGWSGNFLDHTPAGLTAGVHRFDPDHGGEASFGTNEGAGWALYASTAAPGNYQIGAFIPNTSISGSTTMQVASVCAQPASATTTGGTAFPVALGVGLMLLATLPLPLPQAGRRALRRRGAE